MKKGKLFVISGPSGVGKDTIVNEYLKNNEGILSISATTRIPREGEENGKHYYFLKKEEFENWIKEDNFLEYAIYNDNYYGTPKSKILETLDKGINVFLVIEVQGALQIKEKIKDSKLIFIMPPSIYELEKRLRNRNTDSEEMIQNRLKIAIKEMDKAKEYDYIITNNKIDTSVKKLENIINNEKN